MGRGGARPNTGGARPGSGRKSSWKSSSKTKMLRVPEDIAAEVLGYAHKLDRQRVTEANIKQLLESLVTATNADLASVHSFDNLLNSGSPENADGLGVLMETIRRASAGSSSEIPTLDLRDLPIHLLGDKYVVCLNDLQQKYQLFVDPAKFTQKREGETERDIQKQFALNRQRVNLRSPE